MSQPGAAGRKSGLPILLATLLLTLGVTGALFAQVATLQAGGDTRVEQGSPNKNFGGQPTLTLKEGGARALVRFDPAPIVSAIGSGSLASAQLQVYVGANASNWGPTGRTVDIYRLDAPWTETGATWTCADDTRTSNNVADCAAPWNGGTIEDDATDTVLLTNSSNGWISFDVTADVQAFLAGTANEGWLIRKTDEGQAGRVDLVAKEGAPGQAPRLVLLVESATLDTVPPALAIVAPAQPVLVNVASPGISVSYHDGGSGIDLSTLHVFVDRQDLAASCTVSAAAAQCTPPPLAAGTHTLTVTLSDHAGNGATATRSFRLLLGPSVGTATLPVVADTFVTGAAPNGEHGRSPTLRVAKSGSRRALVQFDPAAVTATLAGSQLVSAQLQVSIAANGNNWGASGRPVGAYPLAVGWSEATATWNCPADTNLSNDQADCAVPWIGGTFPANPTATVLHTRGLSGTITFDVTHDIAAFLGGTADDGWVLKKVDETESGRVDYVSREATTGQPAQLILIFQIPAPPDTTQPTIAISSPNQPMVDTAATPIVVTYSDTGSGVDTSTLTIALDGTSLGGCTVGTSSASCPWPALVPGGHAILASIRDLAGNAANASFAFQLSAPLPTISITSPADGSYSRQSSIQVTGTTSGPATTVTVNGVPATLGAGTFTATVPITEGGNQLFAQASDNAGDLASDAVLVTMDTHPPTLQVTSPISGSITNQPQVLVTGTAQDDSGLALLTVAGQPVPVDNGQFSTSVPLAQGVTSIEVDALDLAGNQQTATVAVTAFSIPTVVITSPADLSYISGTTLTVGGTVSTSTALSAVSINGVTATVSGTTFSATGVPLVEGGNTITATATDTAGHVGMATINVVRDLTPPHVAIYTPSDGATLGDPAVTVSGLVNDIVAGTVNAANVTVTVNGLPATVANRSFLVSGVPLQPGDNVLTAVAVDASGNQAQTRVTVRRTAPTTAHIALIAGSGQTAVIRTQLPQPLVAAALDAAGHSLPGTTVLFRVRGGDGTVDGGGRSVAVTTDANGQALAHFTLGSHAGAGNQSVEASAGGFGPPAVFLASALPGRPALIVVDSGDQQLGVTGQVLPRPLVAAVVDAGANRLPGVAVTFTVVKGTGTFANGQTTLPLLTDSDGRVIATLTTDPTEGVANNIVTASITSRPAGPLASFTASTLAAGDPAQTAVSGVVLDNSNLPIAGVTLRIRDTTLTTVTDPQGLFQLSPVPAGTLKLIVDGSTAQRSGSWPDLEFDVTTVPGRNNALRMPVYLLPLDLASGIQIDETHGGTLTLPQLPGFALQIQPGSVTFPNGGRSGLVSVTVVHSDKVPMVPNFGQQPRLIVTIQPAGARFDPPARLTLPNVEGFAAGQVTEFYSFDHDLGHFVSIGPGTVSDDGTVVTSNVGVGIVKAGWHCSGNPVSSGTPNDCPDCQDCNGPQCINRTLCKTCNNTPGNACNGQGKCLAGADLIPFFCGQPGQDLGIVTANVVMSQCAAADSTECGGMLHVDYTKVTHHCDSVALLGAQLREEVKSDHHCAKVDGKQDDVCTVTGGNLLLDCHDDYYFCPKTEAVPTPYDCTQTLTQNLYIGSCLAETHIITMRTVKTAAGCSGSVTRN